MKASIIGCGNVGATTAYAFLLAGVVNEICLTDINHSKAKGLLLDLDHALPFTPNVKLNATDDFSACGKSDLVVITAGQRQKEGETRLDLVKNNKKIFSEILPKIVKSSPNAIYLIISNPVDVLTYHTLKETGLPENQVFGSGTILDSARLQFHVSQHIKVHPGSIDCYVLGEHGDSSFPVYSSANVLGKALMDFEGFSEEFAKKCFKETQEAAYRIIHDQGYTCYAISVAVREIVRAIAEDQHKVFPVSVMLDNYYGHSDICLSVPCIIGKNGVEKTIKVPLNKKEQEDLTKSVKKIREFL